MAKNQNNNVAPATQKTEPGAKKDALATALAQIEKQFGKGAIMKLGDNTAMQVDAISTGSLGLDLALGVGGVPRGRIIEVFGPESSGKTTLALHILAEAQKKGGEVEMCIRDSITVLLVLLVEVMFLYSATRSYYNGVQQTDVYKRQTLTE